MKKKIIVLGSTGSIGVSTLEAIENQRDEFDVVGLACRQNTQLFSEQIRRFEPQYACLFEGGRAGEVDFGRAREDDRRRGLEGSSRRRGRARRKCLCRAAPDSSRPLKRCGRAGPSPSQTRKASSWRGRLVIEADGREARQAHPRGQRAFGPLPVDERHGKAADRHPGADPGHGPAVPHAQPELPRAAGARRALRSGRAIAGWRCSARTSPPRAASGGRPLDLGPAGVPGRRHAREDLTAPDRFAIVPSRTRATSGSGATRCSSRSCGGAGGLARGAISTPGPRSRWATARIPTRSRDASRPTVAGLNVTIPGELSRLLRQSTAFFSALLLGIGALGLVIGGLSLSNTVTAAVFERIRDFGIKRALGATDCSSWRGPGRGAPREPLGRAARGGTGARGRHARGRARPPDGQQLFLFSPRLLGFALVFSVVLGALAAAYATLRIARLSPAEAIRRGA